MPRRRRPSGEAIFLLVVLVLIAIGLVLGLLGAAPPLLQWPRA
jgi:hypothetical protein